MSFQRKLVLGVSLVETTISTAIMATLLGATAPSWVDQAARRRTEAMAAQFETDFQLARSEAVQLSRSVRLSFRNDALGSCYIVHTGAAADCRCDSAGATVCAAGASVLRVAASRIDSGVSLRSTSASMLIDAVGGTVTPTSTVQFNSSAGSLHQVVNIMGRVRSCTPDGSMPGHRQC